MSARLSLSLCGLCILGCAAPVAPTLPEAQPEVASADVTAVDTAGTDRAAPRAEHARSRTVSATSTPPPVIDPGTPDGGGGAAHAVCPKPAGITQVNDRSWTVTRSLVDQWQANPYSLGNVQEDGEGWQLMGARTHPAYHLGMRNGDILLEVNGHKLNTNANLLGAYLACKNDTKFDVVFLRKGNRVTHHYEIVN